MRAIFAVGDSRSAAKYLAGQWALISYAYWGTSWLDNLDTALAVFAGLVIDCGAFTIWQRELKGEAKPGAINVETYARFLLEEAPPHEWALSFDVIGNGPASMRQHLQLMGLLGEKRNIVPVYHEGDSLDLLDAYIATSDLVALGRTDGRRSERKTFEFYDAVFNRHPNGVFHALGNSSPTTIEPYPFASFDSTGWQRNAAYSNALPWPYNRVSKDLRIRAHIEAITTIAHRPIRQLSLGLGAA